MDSAEAFEAAAGFDTNTIFLVLAAAGCVAAILWAAWALISTYRGWAKGNVDGDVMSFAAVRLLLLILIFIWLFV
ncbi:TIGR03758 family integrating conjugative element protein [Billgrantia ethanolica]|uniref:TIGR03758 family integrating conjugative element protein n=1 Tax=Billgrantia ethanolica TaxID=2733486 RepID=A0ABS9A9I5_9GAMM|nr:TIGR03758 family integrating conjugative element protein [Halomonas ethanolica]MCE8005305.1 TIGR03758 family integrating conjugative element protein [Halomonas ethanolica]